VYQSIFYNRKTGNIHLWDDKNGQAVFKYVPYAYRKQPGGHYRSIYGDELEKTTKFYRGEDDLFESDVPVETRVLVDAYGESDDVSVGHRLAVIDIEVNSTGGFPEIKNPKQHVTAIAVYDAPTKHYYCFILDPDKLVKTRTEEHRSILSFETEEDLLMAFLTKWEEMAPTIATGWNIDGFDFPYLHARLCYVFDEKQAGRLSPIGIAYYNRFKEKMTIAGINTIDYLYLYKQYSGKNLPNLRLDTVGQEELKVGKVDYEGSLDDLMKSDINKFIEYNLHDVVLVVKMDEKLQFIELARNICHVCHTGYEEFNISGKILEGALLTYLRRKRLVAPNKNFMNAEEEVFSRDDKDDDDDDSVVNDKVGFKGAYVKDPIPGRYDWVCSADINSLYPSTIMSLNISPETKLGRIAEWSSEKLVKKTDDAFEFAGETTTYAEFADEIAKNNLAVSANGVVYDQAKVGCIPDILKKWFNERLEYKKKMVAASDAKDKPGEVFWKRRQHVQKILLNSLYGVLGLPSFRFYDLDNAEAVTSTGQEIIKTSAKMVNTWFNKKCKTTDKDYVIYIDTDSLYLDINALAKYDGITDIKPYAIQTIGKVSDDLNAFYKVMMPRMFNSTDNRIKIAADVVAEAAFWIVKKRYAMKKVYDMELHKDIDKVEIKGLDVVRSSFPKKFRAFMESVLMQILRNTPKKEVDLFVLDFKKQIKTFNIEDVAKNTSVKFKSNETAKEQIDFNPKSRDAFHFIGKSTAQCKAALAYNDLLKHHSWKDTEPILHGAKIKWVYLKENPFALDGLAFKDDGKDPAFIMEMINMYADRNQIWEKELVKKLTAFYEAMSWEIFREEQATIDNFFSFD
jgi:DNA polymerase elongation subunit (family B)